MADGYAIEWTGAADRYGRQLVTVRLEDGREAGEVLVAEGLSQRWPGKSGVWCP